MNNDYANGSVDADAMIFLKGIITNIKGKMNISFGYNKCIVQFTKDNEVIELSIPADVAKKYLGEVVGGVKPFNHKDWLSVHCDSCGDQAYCPKCKKYIWRKKDDGSGN